MPASNQHYNQSTESEESSLASPHFDERAVATAHAVQPLPRRYVSQWQRRALMIAVLAVGFVSVVALAIFWVVSSNGPAVVDVDKVTADVQAVASPQPTIDQSPQISRAKPKPLASQRNSPLNGRVVIEEPGKRVARRVGVITYGHSRARP